MRSLHTQILTLFLSTMLTWSPAAMAQEVEPVQKLFNGSDLSGWHGNNPHTTAKADPADREKAVAAQQPEFQTHWRVENGELVNDGHGPYATTDQEFGDIEFTVDYKTVAKADSGIYLRGTPQIQIWDTTKGGGKWDRGADKGSGGLFNNRKGQPGQLPLALADNAFGQWNRFRVTQVGARTWVELNHKLVVDGAIMENYWDKARTTPLPARGPIHLQTHGGEIRWRNITARDIDSNEAITRLRGDDSKYGFSPIFNGTDLEGWAGAKNDYEVVGGAIVCKPGRGGVLFTEQQYSDFVVRLEFQLPAGGNNGLAIRYPGSGRASYDGMCELQVLDNDDNKYKNLDPRQYHGSVYGVAPAHRGYLRPVGQWNYQEVTVRGSTIRVELNGTVIVDADVSKVTEYKDGLDHPGIGLTQGHFGFAGHNDPVKFRNIAIKQLSRPTAKTRVAAPLLFYASFDDVTDANLSTGDGWIHTAKSTRRNSVTPHNGVDSVAIAEGAGRFGDALRFEKKTPEALFYEGQEFGYREKDWSGTVSMWLKLDPDRDLEPGFCDPIQITERGWNDGAFFVDFDKELPRDFRLGVFPDYKAWNPDDIKFDDIPVDKRPMVTVQNPPFGSEDWTHVCFTWENINAADGGPATAKLYLNGELQGSINRPMKFTWNPEKVGIMIGINYIGLIDDLAVYSSQLTQQEVKMLSQKPVSQL